MQNQVLSMLMEIRDELRAQRRSLDNQLATIHSVVDSQLTRAVNHFLLVTGSNALSPSIPRPAQGPSGALDLKVSESGVPIVQDLALVREQCLALVKNARELAARDIEQAEMVAARFLERAITEAAERVITRPPEPEP
jgi:hypothetical protein